MQRNALSDLVLNERTKLLASLLNALSSGFVVTGVVAPIVAVLYGVPGPANTSPLVITLTSLAWLIVGICLHLCRFGLLRRLR